MTSPTKTPKFPKKLQGQVAVITGGGRGIGAAAARLLAQAGAAVVITARSEDEIEQVAQSIRQNGGKAIAVPCDVSDLGQIEEVSEAALTQFERVDILVNNAGIIWPIEEAAYADPTEWAYNIHVNLVGAFSMTNNLLPIMMEQGHGRVLNITSGAAEHVIPGWSAYCTAKAGLNMMTRALAEELKGTGVRVNALSPGMVDTEMQADIRSVDTGGSDLDYSSFHHAHELGTLNTPDAIARMIYWIVGPWGSKESGRIFAHNDETWMAQLNNDLGD
jgi:NAD(P)-dependent dehydrogenase (short-subunit alcohol dehydrogenase family)